MDAYNFFMVENTRRLIKTNYRVPEATRESSAGKSARRMLEMLEYFGEERRPLSIREIAEHFGYPHSSASVLVKTAATLGYLSYDLERRVYSPTLRLPALGSWVYESLCGSGDVLTLVSEVAERTGETTVIAVQNDIYSQYVHVIPSRQAIQFYIPTGNRLLLCHSGTGWALLSTHSDHSIARLVRRTQLRLGKAAESLNYRKVQTEVNGVRRRGYAFSRGLVTAGGAMIAMPVPTGPAGIQLVLGVASLVERMDVQAPEVLKAMRSALRRYVRASA